MLVCYLEGLIGCSLEETFLPWLQQTVDLMLPLLTPPPEGFEPPPPTAVPPPIYSLDFESKDLPDMAALSITSNGNGPSDLETAPIRAVDDSRGQISDVWKPDDWGWATLSKNKRVTKEDWWQDVREVELDILDQRLYGCLSLKCPTDRLSVWATLLDQYAGCSRKTAQRMLRGS